MRTHFLIRKHQRSSASNERMTLRSEVSRQYRTVQRRFMIRLKAFLPVLTAVSSRYVNSGIVLNHSRLRFATQVLVYLRMNRSFSIRSRIERPVLLS